MVTRQWRAAIVSSGTVAAAWILTWVITPNDSFNYFFHGGLSADRTIGDHVGSVDNQSIAGFLMRTLHTSHLPTALWLLAALPVLALVMLAARRLFRSGNLLPAAVVVGLGSTLVSPVSWVHHNVYLVVVPALLWQLSADKISRPFRWVMTIGFTLALAVPPASDPWSPLYGRVSDYHELITVLAIVLLTVLAQPRTLNTTSAK
jgi:alpha-1,2-mannosyltransferase